MVVADAADAAQAKPLFIDPDTSRISTQTHFPGPVCFNMSLNYRRAEAGDAQSIQCLISGDGSGKDNMAHSLQRRYGDNYSIAHLINSSPMSIVATDTADKRVYGFIALSLVPPLHVISKIISSAAEQQDSRNISTGPWDEWLKAVYEFQDVKIYNTAFVSFLCVDPDYAVKFLDTTLTTSFKVMSDVKHICYFLPNSLILFPPFSSQWCESACSIKDDADADSQAAPRHPSNLKKDTQYFTEVPVINSSTPFSLLISHRHDLVPAFHVRAARVEDCDDLVPILQQHNLFKGDQADFYLAKLVESESESSKTLVAEVDGKVVGFMSISQDINQAKLNDAYHLDMFDFLLNVDAQSRHDLNFQKGAITPDINQVTLEDKSRVGLQRPVEQNNEAYQSESVDESQSIYAHQRGMPDMIDQSDPQTFSAFCISMFCIESHHETRSAEFVRGAFLVFKEHEYCLISLPPNTSEMKILRHFSTVEPKESCDSPHNLYITNRYGLGDLVTVRPGVLGDAESIDALLYELNNQANPISTIKDALKHDMLNEPSPVRVYIAETLDQIVGVVVLKTCVDPQPYIDQYQVEAYISPKCCPFSGKPIMLEHMLLNPLFEMQTRWVVQEVMRQADCPCLLYSADEDKRQDSATKRLALRELVPVRRRRVIQFPGNLRDGSPIADPIPFNLQLITPTLLFEQRATINSRIVVIGDSDVGTAFLEKLVYSPYLQFTHLKLISMNDICEPENLKYFSTSRCYTQMELKQMRLEYYVQVINSQASELDRESKLVKLSSGDVVHYDYLILCPDAQFNASKLDMGLGELGCVYSMTKSNDASIQKAIMNLNAESESMLAIFGNSIQAYATVEMLLHMDVSPSRIVLVDPFLESKGSCFNDQAVESQVFKNIEKIGVQHYKGYTISKWGVDDLTLPKSLSGLVIASHQTNELVHLPLVHLLIYSDEQSVDNNTFKLINDSFLVFDGRLVIDNQFRTNDPLIFGAGSSTKYSSRYKTQWSHTYYDAREVGTRLADTLLQLLDSTRKNPEFQDHNGLLQFTAAKSCEAYLPGGMYYLHFDCPRLPGLLSLQSQNAAIYGRDMIIDNDQTGYFKIHLDVDGFITSITYIGRDVIPADNILCLYGVHQKYLNRLVSRFDEGVITDFITYLSEPWALPLYHDRFPLFAKFSRESGMAAKTDEMEAIIAHLKHHANGSTAFAEQELATLYKLFDQSDERKEWDAKVFDFLFDTRVFNSYP
ncbi:hypothetical protein BASA83_008099 [Batrachochytrium salamandrivorans]|nr:hypothetical protein BASA62_008265 [Batrachochytrium salamandrivorans]KAH9269784.1 hypothetical protein BASA83_008099 [Batrachochytrium salamandrivorans]